MKNGFTLVETVVSLTIILLMALVLIPSYALIRRSMALDSETIELSQNVRRAQEMSMSAKELEGGAVPGGYGVYFNLNSPDSYIIFADKNGNEEYNSGEAVETIALKNSVEIVEMNSYTSGGAVSGSFNTLSVIYQPPEPIVVIKGNGAGYSGNQVSIKVEGGNARRKIFLNIAGLVDVDYAE